MIDFSGRVVLVTGSTQNLGYTIASAFLSAGARVILHGPTGEEADAAGRLLSRDHQGRSIETIGFDLGNQNQIEAGFSTLKQRNLSPDVLINNAAHQGIEECGFFQQNPDCFRRVLEINLLAPFYCSQLAAREMKARGGGSIVNISSLAGERAIWGRSAYTASKSALDGLTRGMSLELSQWNIRVNAIAPGYVWTPRWNQIDESASIRRIDNIPWKRPTQQMEVANLALFLASDQAPSLIGTRVVIDGGMGSQQVPQDASL